MAHFQSNKLLPLLDDFFSFESQLQDESHSNLGNLTDEQFRVEIKTLLKHYEHSARDQQVDAELIQKSQYALIAFVDEWIIRHSERFKSTWVGHPLQLEFFGENTAGARFFQQLDTMRLQSEHFIDALEIYYLCLELGYQGQYRLENGAALLKIKKDVLLQIKQVRKHSDLSLSITASGCSVTGPFPKRFPMKALILGALSSCFIVGIIYWLLFQYQSNQDRQVILEVQQQLNAQQTAL